MRFNVLGYDNVERIFAQEAESVPLNVDKGVRCAFITPPTTIDETELPASTRSLLEQLEAYECRET
jgi:hypothetical protein